jgi:hypothetical protein
MEGMPFHGEAWVCVLGGGRGAAGRRTGLTWVAAAEVHLKTRLVIAPLILAMCAVRAISCKREDDAA